MRVPGGAAVRRLALEILGWLMLVGGLAALVLPGPGLLLLFGGLALLSQQYDWAERRLEPIRLRALLGAAEGVETWPRIVLSTLGALMVGGFGLLWTISPPAPEWWPLATSWWLLGGVWAGATLMISCVLALALIVYSYRRFHGKPDAVAELRGEITEADEDREDLPHLRAEWHRYREERDTDRGAGHAAEEPSASRSPDRD